jgi:multidrug efflux pump subunit AcrA (membrane-fusion protein)
MDWMLLSRLKPILLAVLFFLATAGSLSAPMSPAAAGIAAAPVGQGIPESLQLKGRIVPRNWVYLSFPSGGRLARILVEEGQSVSAGAALASLEGSEAATAGLAAAQVELLAASRALDQLYRNAGVALAQAEYDLAEARHAYEQADWKVRRMKEPPSQLRVEQARANLQLAESGLQKARQDLEKAEKFFNNWQDPAWQVLSRREFRQNLALLSQQVAQAERKFVDALEKHNDLLAPVDEIDLAQAEAVLRVTEARVARAAQDRDKLSSGPNPEEVALAQARLAAAEKALRAAEFALAEKKLAAPFAGKVLAIPGHESQWADPGEPVLVLADVSGWKIRVKDIKESEVIHLQALQPVAIRLDALPDLELDGQVESIAWVFQEKDGEVNYSAEVALPDGQPELRWGMTARIEILLPSGASTDG